MAVYYIRSEGNILSCCWAVCRETRRRRSWVLMFACEWFEGTPTFGEKRDSEWNGPIFEFLGLRVDCIDKHEPNGEELRAVMNLAPAAVARSISIAMGRMRKNIL